MNGCWKQKTRHLGKSGMTKAINYSLNRWDGLTKFIYDGRLDLDTNAVERQFKPIITTRKNSGCAGSMNGAAAWAIYATLFETAKMHGLDRYKYLLWVLDTIRDAKERSEIDYEKLLPWNAPKEYKIGAKEVDSSQT